MPEVQLGTTVQPGSSTWRILTRVLYPSMQIPPCCHTLRRHRQNQYRLRRQHRYRALLQPRQCLSWPNTPTYPLRTRPRTNVPSAWTPTRPSLACESQASRDAATTSGVRVCEPCWRTDRGTRSGVRCVAPSGYPKLRLGFGRGPQVTRAQYGQTARSEDPTTWAETSAAVKDALSTLLQ